MNRTRRGIAGGAMVALAAGAVIIDFVLPVEQGIRPLQPAATLMYACYLGTLIVGYFAFRRWQTQLATLIAILALWCLLPLSFYLSGDFISGTMLMRRAIGGAMLLIVGGGMLVHKRTALELLRLNAELEAQVESRTRQYREAAAAALRARAEFDAIARIALDGVAISEDGVVVSVSPRLAERLGYTPAQIVGSRTLSHIAEHFRQAAIAEFRDASCRPYDLLLIRGDGSTVRMETYSTRFRDEGKDLYVCGFRDMSERLAQQREIAEVTEHERRRVGQELNDNLGQLLVSLGWAAESLAKASADLEPDLEPEARHIAALAARCLEDCRQLARQLAPSQVARLGLGPMLEVLKQRVEATPGFRCRLGHAREVQIEDDHTVYHLYAVAEEAVSSALKHGGGTEISIGLKRAGSHHVLTVADDGCSMSARQDGGAGLRSMRYRARLIDGIIDIEAPASGGTIVRCTIPAASASKSGPGGKSDTDRRQA